MRNSPHSVSLGTFGLAFAIVLSPAFLRGVDDGGFSYSCARSSNTNLSGLELLVDGEDQIAFVYNELAYDVWLPLVTESALVRAVPVDPTTQVFFRVSTDSESFDVGGREAVIPLAPGLNTIEVHVVAEDNTRASDYIIYTRVGCSDCSDGNECTTDDCDPVLEVCTGHTPLPVGTPCGVVGGIPGLCGLHGEPICSTSCASIECADDFNDCTGSACEPASGACVVVADGTPCAGGSCVSGVCELTGQVQPCTEQGIRNAIAAGGGPYTFDCAGPTTIATAAEILIDNSVILDGEGALELDASHPGRVISVAAGVEAELRGFTIRGGSAVCCSGLEEWGGGIFNAGTLTLVESVVQDNVAQHGGGIVSWGTTMLMDSAVSNNHGGGILGSNVTLNNSSVSGNTGRGIAGDNLTLLNSTVSGNTSDGIGVGGGSVTNSTVSANGGHGIYNSGTLTLTNTTVSGNTLYGIYGVGGTMFVTNSTISGSGLSAIFAHGGVDHEASLDIAGTLIDGHCAPWEDPVWISSGDNFESPGNTCRFDHATDRVDVTAAELSLGPLQDNGGPTETHALLPGSVAIDWIPLADCLDADGVSLNEDQRGVSRPQGIACDVGAFELEQ